MSRQIAATLALVLAWAVTAAAGPAEQTTPPASARVPAFTAQAIDLSGKEPKTETVDSRDAKHVTAYIIVGIGCSATNAYAERLRQLEQAYRPKGVDFLYVYPNREETTEAKLASHRERRFTGRLIDDQTAHVAHQLGAQKSSEVFLVDRKGNIVYHGAVDDSKENPEAVKQRYVATALDETLANKAVTTPASQVFA